MQPDASSLYTPEVQFRCEIGTYLLLKSIFKQRIKLYIFLMVIKIPPNTIWNEVWRITTGERSNQEFNVNREMVRCIAVIVDMHISNRVMDISGDKKMV